jgi:hypothetical protein
VNFDTRSIAGGRISHPIKDNGERVGKMRLELDLKNETHQKLDELLKNASTDKPRDVDVEILWHFLRKHPEL